jgi:hypothetical protein
MVLYRKGGKSGIRINPENRGKFTIWCKRQGFKSVTSECKRKGKASKNKNVRAMATFATNAAGWNKA